MKVAAMVGLMGFLKVHWKDLWGLKTVDKLVERKVDLKVQK